MTSASESPKILTVPLGYHVQTRTIQFFKHFGLVSIDPNPFDKIMLHGPYVWSEDEKQVQASKKIS